MQETRIWALGQEDPLEKGMATHCNILAWRIPWTAEPDRLQAEAVDDSRVKVESADLQVHSQLYTAP